MWSDHINYYGDMRTHQLVLKWIEKQLSDGELALGGRLPAERTLAEQLSVSRTSVREAIRILEAMGVVRAGVGSGPDAGTVVIADPTAALGSALRLHVATRTCPSRTSWRRASCWNPGQPPGPGRSRPSWTRRPRLLDEMDAATRSERTPSSPWTSGSIWRSPTLPATP